MTARLQPSKTPASIDRAKQLVDPALRTAVDAIADERMRLVAGYQLGWWDAEGRPTPSGGGKALRPTLAVLAADAACGSPEAGIPAAVAVELVHNFSLLHDDIMDRDVERRHRPTGWVAFGEGQAILAGNAMLTAAVEAAIAGPNAERVVPALLQCVQRLISGQSADLALEQRTDAELADVLDMEIGKTAALISCALTTGALAAGASDAAVERLHKVGELVGLAFQLVDDVLGIVGDPQVTGKSASSDLRAGKRSAPVVAALTAGNAAAQRLADLLHDGPPESDDEVAIAAKLVDEAGGIDWARNEARTRVAAGCAELRSAGLVPTVEADLVALGSYVLERDR